MTLEANETPPRETGTRPKRRQAWKWSVLLLRTAFWVVWAVDKVLRFFAWLFDRFG